MKLSTLLEVRDPHGYHVRLYCKSYYIDDPVTGEKVRVTDASGSSFYANVTRKEDLFFTMIWMLHIKS